MSLLLDRVDAVEPQIRAVWQQIHSHPELGMELYHTADLIEAELAKHCSHVKVKRVDKAGVWVELEGTAPGDKDNVLMLRGDMDALPIQEEENGLPYRSQVPNVMHACGHDVHGSTLLGAVRVLEQYRDRFAGKIWFFFQPGEEILGGAKAFLADPDIDFSRVRACAACHVLGFTEVGKINVRYGQHLAATGTVTFRVKGKSAHSSTPNETVDAVVVASQLVLQLQTLISREINPADMVALNLGHIHAGDPSRPGWIAGEVVIKGGLRSVSPVTCDKLVARMQAIAEGLSLATRAEIEFTYVNESPALINDPKMCDIAAAAVKKTLGEDKLELGPFAALAGEDFAFFTQHCPGVHISLGCRTPGRAPVPAHCPQFYTDPGVIRSGIAMFSAFALEYFGVDY